MAESHTPTHYTDFNFNYKFNFSPFQNDVKNFAVFRFLSNLIANCLFCPGQHNLSMILFALQLFP